MYPLLLFGLLLFLILLLILIGARQTLTVTQYTISVPTLTQPVRLALVTDLHACQYGPGQQELLDTLSALSPDGVLLGGDIFDDRLPPGPAQQFVTAAAETWPTFYVSGNHECRTGALPAIKDFIRQAGGDVLEGTCSLLTVKGQTIQICGVDDPRAAGLPELDRQLTQASRAKDPAAFSLLLSHRPDLIETYRQHTFDLILCGHAHGGQWRIPGLLNGLYAPNQGLFPPYAGGWYVFPSCTMVVSRGLARETTWVPRLFNPPELVLLILSNLSDP